MKYQSMKCSCNPEPTALVFSRGEFERREKGWEGDKKRSLIFILESVCLTSLKLKYEGNVSESQTPDIWSSIGQKQLKIPFVILEIRSRVLSNIFLSLKPNFLLLIPHRHLTVFSFVYSKELQFSPKMSAIRQDYPR